MTFDSYEDPIEALLHNMAEHGLENTAISRFYSHYEARIESVEGYEKDGRVQVSVPALDLNGPHPKRAFFACQKASPDAGVFLPPVVGDTCFVGFHLGDHTSIPLIFGYIWKKIPKEFDSTDKAGFKSNGGSSLVFDDTPNDRSVELSLATTKADAVADKVHSIKAQKTSNDSDLTIETEGGQTGVFRDTGSPGVVFSTAGGCVFELLDDKKHARITTPSGMVLLMSDTDQIISITTPTGQSVNIDESAGSIVINALKTLQTTVAGNHTSTSTGVMSFVAAGLKMTTTKPTVVEGAALTETYSGLVTRTITGLYNLSVTGIATLVFLGGLIFDVTGVLTLAGTNTDSILGLVKQTLPGGVQLGARDATTLRLANENLAALVVDLVLKYNTHVHPSVGSAPLASFQVPVQPLNKLITTTLRGN